MPDLARDSMGACEHFSIQDDRSAHARSKRYHHHIAVPPAAALPQFSESRRICVVADTDLFLQAHL